MHSNLSCLVFECNENNKIRFLMKGENIFFFLFFFKYFRFQCTGKIAQYFRFAEKSGDNHPKYLTYSVVWKYKLGVICTNMLQIPRKICFKVNNFFYRSLKKGNFVYIIFFIKVKDSNELSIAANFFIVIWPAF